MDNSIWSKTLSSAASGAMAGAAAGGIGAVPGALIGGGVTLLSGALSGAFKKEEEPEEREPIKMTRIAPSSSDVSYRHTGEQTQRTILYDENKAIQQMALDIQKRSLQI